MNAWKGGAFLSDYIIQLRQITKAFGKVQANDHIDINISRGGIHALLGENGSGKSTLMNILFGLQKMDSGEIFVKGESVIIDSPLDAIRHGIGMIHQEFMLIPDLTVGENLMIGVLEKGRNASPEAALEKQTDFAEQFDLKQKLNRPVRELSVGEQQKVEIAKTLYQGAEIIILDEPTSVLTPQESVRLFEILTELTKIGKTIILITHKLEEVLSYTQEVTILRAGRRVDTFLTEDTDKYGLAEKMVGRKILFQLHPKMNLPGEDVVKVEHLQFTDDAGVKKLDDVSFSIRKGEILGIAGVDGNGQVELSEILAGVRIPEQGVYRIGSTEVKKYRPGLLADFGVSFIPGERNNYGCVAALSIQRNLVLKSFCQKRYCKRGILNWTEIKKTADGLIDQYRIKAPNCYANAGNLSGGNLQKVILARELANNPRFLICVQPTRGLDIGAVEFVQNALLDARDRGISILLISTELDEIFALSDRLAVISRGRIVDIMDNSPDVDIGYIGLLMAGVEDTEHCLTGGAGI